MEGLCSWQEQIQPCTARTIQIFKILFLAVTFRVRAKQHKQELSSSSVMVSGKAGLTSFPLGHRMAVEVPNSTLPARLAAAKSTEGSYTVSGTSGG